MSRKNGKRLVIDLDGTLCEQVDLKNYFTAPPKIDVIKTVNQMWCDGWEVVIYTARGMNTYKGNLVDINKNLRDGTEKWLSENRVCYDELVFGKPFGDVYVDDKGVCLHEFVFSGQSSATLDEED